MRLVIDGDVDAVSEALIKWEYPAPWTPEMLDKCIVAGIMTRGVTAGYVWAAFHHILPDTMDFHACIQEKYRGLWLTSDIVADLEKLASFMGAEALTTTTIGDRASRLVAALLTRRYGYRQLSDRSLFKRLEH